MAIGKVGIGSYSYPQACRNGMTPLELVKKAVSLQVDVVQMADNIHLENYSDEELKETAIYAYQHNILIETGFRGLLPEKFDTYLHITRILEARLMRIVIDAAGFQPSLDEICDLIKDYLPLLKKNHIVLGIETHDRFSAEEFAEIARRIDSENVGIILDAANSLANEELPIAVTEIVAPYTCCYHAKDYIIRRRTTGMGLEIVGTTAGKGRLPICQILNILEEFSPYTFHIILEMWVENCNITPLVLEEEQTHVEESISYLQDLIHKTQQVCHV